MNGDTPAPKKRNWIAIVLGVLLLFGILGVGCVVITVFKSLGMAVEDVVAADLVFRRASESGAGTELTL